MVTKATTPVIDLSLPIDTFNLRGAGTSSIDGTPIGATTPSTGVFTNLTINTGLTLAAGATITGLPITVKNAVVGTAVQPFEIVNSSDGVPVINSTAAPITPTSITATGLVGSGLTKLGDYVKIIIPQAKTGAVIASGGLVMSSDTGVPYLNKTASSITLTGSTASVLGTDGLVDMGKHIATEFVPVAKIGVGVTDKQIVLSSDGILMLNRSGVTKTPTTGTATAANLVTDGFEYLGTYVSKSVVTNAAIGTAVPANDIVVSTDGLLMVNKSGATVTPSTGTATATDLTTDGLVTLSSVIASIPSGTLITNAVIGTTIPRWDIVVSSDGVAMYNNSNGSITPSTGTATAANLAADGLTELGLAMKLIIPAAVVGNSVQKSRLVMSSQRRVYINLTNAAITLTGINNTGLTTDGLTPLGTAISNLNAVNYVTNAAIGTAVPANDIVVSTDGTLMLNNSGASVTPSTGTATAADLTADGLTELGQAMKLIIPAAVVGNNVGKNRLVMSSQKKVFINLTNAGITLTGINNTGLTGDGLTPLGTAISNLSAINHVTNAAIGTAVAVNDIVVSSDGILMINASAAAITPSTGTATAANLTTDGLVALGTEVKTAATKTKQGIIEIATNNETKTGTDTTRAVVPSSLHATANTRVLTEEGVTNLTAASATDIAAMVGTDKLAVNIAGVPAVRAATITDVLTAGGAGNPYATLPTSSTSAAMQGYYYSTLDGTSTMPAGPTTNGFWVYYLTIDNAGGSNVSSISSINGQNVALNIGSPPPAYGGYGVRLFAGDTIVVSTVTTMAASRSYFVWVPTI